MCGPVAIPRLPRATPRLPHDYPRGHLRGYPPWLPPVATPWLPPVATPWLSSLATPWLASVMLSVDTLRGYPPWLLCGYSVAAHWLPSVATLRGYPPWLPPAAALGLSRGYFPWRPSVATPCGYSAGGWRTLGAGAGRGRGLSAGGKRIITRRIASLRTRVGDSGWVPEGSLAGFFARHEPALPLICGGDRTLASPRDQQPLKHQSCREPWGIMAQKPQLETSSAT